MKKLLSLMVVSAILILSGRLAVAMDPLLLQQNSLVGAVAPDFNLPDLQGNNFSLKQLSKNKSTILFFWATWCPHCRTQIKEIQTNYQQLESKGVEMILIDVGEGQKQVANYLKQNGISIRVLMDRDGATAERYNIRGMPTFVFINREGTVTTAIHHLPPDYENYF